MAVFSIRAPRRSSLALAGAGLAGAAAATALVERAHLQRVRSDPEWPLLSDPPRGRALRARSADGTELHAEEFGRTGAPTLVLIHGWTERLYYWVHVIRELQDEFRIVAYDLRGHGRSSPAVDGDYSVERFGEDLEAVLRECLPEGERAIVAGHSLGGISIAAWAERHDVPARASAAALLFTGMGELIASSELLRLPQIARAVQDPVGRRLFLGARAAMPSFSTPLTHAIIRYVAFGPRATPGQVAFYERMLIGCEPSARAAVGLAMSEIDLHPALARLTVPTLVMAGANDRLTPPSHARRMASLLPEMTELVELPATGHMGPLERPREVAGALRELQGVTLKAAVA